MLSEWANISSVRKIAALKTLVNQLQPEDDELMNQLFELLADFEDDDYFGSEGANL
jgi:hypothetical protein